MTPEDVWLNAFAAFPDIRPLVRLLRSDTPMTAGAREILAELLSPSHPPIDSFVLELKPNADFDKTLRKLGAVAEYKIATGAGMSAEIAAEEAGSNHNVTGRQLFRWLKEDVPQRLGERLRGEGDSEEH
jgi:hypothetical protein